MQWVMVSDPWGSFSGICPPDASGQAPGRTLAAPKVMLWLPPCLRPARPADTSAGETDILFLHRLQFLESSSWAGGGWMQVTTVACAFFQFQPSLFLHESTVDTVHFFSMFGVFFVSFDAKIFHRTLSTTWVPHVAHPLASHLHLQPP